MKVYPPDHTFGRATKYALYSFVASDADSFIQVYIVWGLKPVDRSECHFSDPQCNGVADFDDTFDPNSHDAQTALRVCILSVQHLCCSCLFPSHRHLYNCTFCITVLDWRIC